MLKCFLCVSAALAFMFSCADDVSGTKVAGRYTVDEVTVDGLDEVNAAFNKFGYSGSESAHLELKGAWEIHVDALEFEIADVQALDVLELNRESKPCLKDNLRLCTIKAKYPTRAKVTLTSLDSNFLEGKRHFLKVGRKEDAIYLHKTKTTGTIVIGADGVEVCGGITASDCAEGDDNACRNDAVPAGDDLVNYFPDLINKDNSEIDISARYEIKVEAVAVE